MLHIGPILEVWLKSYSDLLPLHLRMYCIDTEALVFNHINNKKHVHHGFLAPQPYLCSTSLIWPYQISASYWCMDERLHRGLWPDELICLWFRINATCWLQHRMVARILFRFAFFPFHIRDSGQQSVYIWKSPTYVIIFISTKWSKKDNRNWSIDIS